MVYDETLKMVNDHLYLPSEQFPRQMLFEIRDTTQPGDADASAETWLLQAQPNHFPNGPLTDDEGNRSGYGRLPTQIGNRLYDNSYVPDGYRFHDAMHISFAASLGNSAVLRGLMGLKRRSNAIVDAVEDGGRAIALEEGLVAHLGQLSLVDGQQNFAVSADAGTRSLMRSYETLGAGPPIPALRWAKAISHGLMAMHRLRENNGGFLLADLDAPSGSLKYSVADPTKTD